MPPRSDHSDLLVTHWPSAVWMRRALFEFHEPPLWNPAILGGQPFAADPLAGVWYPPNWLLLIPGTPLAVMFNLLFLAHMVWGGWGMYRFVRTSGTAGPAESGLNQGQPSLGSFPGAPHALDHWIAMFGAVAFMGMPKPIAHLGAGHVSLFFAVAWTPWLLSAVRKAAVDGGVRSGAVAGAVLAALFLADVRWAVYAGLLAACYWAWSAVTLARSPNAGTPANASIPWGRGRVNPVAAHLAALSSFVVFFAALTAVLGLPLYEFVQHSRRAALTFQEASDLSLPARYLVGLLIPDLGGFHEWMTYLGFLPFVLAVVGTVARHDRREARDRDRAFWSITAVAAILLSLGASTPLASIAFRLAPGFGWLRVPPRAWFVVGFSACVLAAIGSRTLLGDMSRRAARTYSMLAVAGSALAWGLAIGLWIISGRWLPNLLACAVAATAGLALIALRARARIAPAAFVLLVAGFTAADLGWVNSSLVRAISEPEAFAPGNVVTTYLKEAARGRDFRVYSPSYSLPQHVAAQHSLELADGVNPLQLAATVDFMTRATGVPASGYNVTLPPFAHGDPATDNAAYMPSAALLGLLNVRFVASEFDLSAPGLALIRQVGATRVYANTLTQPRAWITFKAQPATDRLAALDVAAQGLTAVEGGPALDGTSESVEATVRRRGFNTLSLDTNADDAGLLVLAEVDYPGWRATIDGRPAAIFRVDGLLRGVYIPTGKHKVEFQFAPGRVLAGAAISLAGLLGLASILAAGRRGGG